MLRKRRNDLKISIKEMEKRCSINRGTLSKIEREIESGQRTNLESETISRLAMGYELTEQDVLDVFGWIRRAARGVQEGAHGN